MAQLRPFSGPRSVSQTLLARPCLSPSPGETLAIALAVYAKGPAELVANTMATVPKCSAVTWSTGVAAQGRIARLREAKRGFARETPVGPTIKSRPSVPLAG